MLKSVTNYLDDFLFIMMTLILCDRMIEELGITVALNKTEWATTRLVFLGILLDCRFMKLAVPQEKRIKAIKMLENMLDAKKVKVGKLQTLCGYLNFLNKAIYPGRAFTRRMYAKFSDMVDVKRETDNKRCDFKWKKHHHVRLVKEFKFDYTVWLHFLAENDGRWAINQSMVDIENSIKVMDISFFSDASAAENLGFGCVYGKRWLYAKWDPDFIKNCRPSIEFLELLALCAGLLIWNSEIANGKFVLHCYNMAIVHMINNLTSSCKFCMYLIRILVLNGLKYNRRLQCCYVRSRDNFLSNALSRLKIRTFKSHAVGIHEFPDIIHTELWLATSLWRKIENHCSDFG